MIADGGWWWWVVGHLGGWYDGAGVASAAVYRRGKSKERGGVQGGLEILGRSTTRFSYNSEHVVFYVLFLYKNRPQHDTIKGRSPHRKPTL